MSIQRVKYSFIVKQTLKYTFKGNDNRMILLNVKPNKKELVLNPYLVRYNHQEQLWYNDGTTEKVRKAILNVTKKATKIIDRTT